MHPEGEGRRPADAVIGTTLDSRYRIEAEIGSGGMSTVYLAFDETLERPVAVKVLHHETSRDPSALERFRREARAVARLSHPHIVMVIDAGKDRGHPYIVFEYVRGETLKDRIRRLGALPVTEAVAYAIEIGRALQAAHESRLVHRDVKPQNVLIDEEGHAKVTDFGIARSLELDTKQLTASGRVLGTTDYVSPEQALGHRVTGQSDVYSLGIVLYEMLVGEVPFKADSSVMVAMKHVREGLPDVQRRRPEVSAALAATVERATSKEVGNRYHSIGDMLHDLEDALTFEVARAGDTEGEATTVLRQLPGKARARGSWRQRLARAALYTSMAVVLAIAVGLLITRLSEQRDRVPSGMGDLSVIRLGSRDARDYDPAPGDRHENSATTGLVLDGNPQTVWQTERYDTAQLGNIKDGVGLVLDAGRAVVARGLRVSTPVDGWELELYVANTVPSTVADWTRVGGGDMSAHSKTFNLDTGTQRFRYFLVWITRLARDPSGRWSAGISELRLLG